ncbi:MAG: hypothetical protein EXR79_11240 [Myxococcales bacterium]|nr:hypothetical protein [Myxococcales bacterium]
MALSIKSDAADRMARELRALTGETLTEAVVVSLSERLARKRAEQDRRPMADRLDDIAKRFHRHARGDGRTLDEIVGYDDSGLPT